MRMMLAVGSAFASLALSAAVTSGARADEMFEPARPSAIVTCPIGGSGSCTRFQGYVVVGHVPPTKRATGDASFADRPGNAGVDLTPDPSLSPERLYLRTGTDETH